MMMLRLLRDYIIKVICCRREVLSSAECNRNSNSIYCDLYCYKVPACAGASKLAGLSDSE